MTLEFNTLTDSITMKLSLAAMSDEDAGWMLYALLVKRAPRVEEEGYEEYQLAAEVILKYFRG